MPRSSKWFHIWALRYLIFFFPEITSNLWEMEMKGLPGFIFMNAGVRCKITTKQWRYTSIYISEHKSGYHIDINIKERNNFEVSEQTVRWRPSIDITYNSYRFLLQNNDLVKTTYTCCSPYVVTISHVRVNKWIIQSNKGILIQSFLALIIIPIPLEILDDKYDICSFHVNFLSIITPRNFVLLTSFIISSSIPILCEVAVFNFRVNTIYESLRHSMKAYLLLAIVMHVLVHYWSDLRE